MFSHGNEHQTFASLCLAVVFLLAFVVCNSTRTMLLVVQIQLLSGLQALITPPPAQIQLPSCLGIFTYDGQPAHSYIWNKFALKKNIGNFDI